MIEGFTHSTNYLYIGGWALFVCYSTFVGRIGSGVCSVIMIGYCVYDSCMGYYIKKRFY